MRRPVAITLVLAFLLALLAPVQAAWACPDGTPCLQERPGELSCPEEPHAKPSCCPVRKIRCKHGAALQGERDRARGIENPDHCRYKVAARPDLTARAEAAPVLFLPVAALPAAEWMPVLEAPAPAWRRPATLGCRPPPCRCSGAARAPPTC